MKTGGAPTLPRGGLNGNQSSGGSVAERAKLRVRIGMRLERINFRIWKSIEKLAGHSADVRTDIRDAAHRCAFQQRANISKWIASRKKKFTEYAFQHCFPSLSKLADTEMRIVMRGAALKLLRSTVPRPLDSMNAPPILSDYLSRAPGAGRSEGGRRTRGEMLSGNLSAPVLSVVTAVLNRRESLERNIQSVLSQDYAKTDHIIVDGGSTDGTLDVLKKYDDRIAYWISEPDGGIFDAMNKGVALARGNYIHLLNSDDFYCPGALARVASEVALSRSDVIFGDYIFVVEDAGLQRRIHVTTDLHNGMTIGHALFVSKNVYERIGLYDTRYRFSGDLDFMLRVRKAGMRFSRIDQALQYFTSGGAAESNLAAACAEAAECIAQHAGGGSAEMYRLRSLKRRAFRAMTDCVRVVFGEGAYRSMRREYYAANGYTPVEKK